MIVEGHGHGMVYTLTNCSASFQDPIQLLMANTVETIESHIHLVETFETPPEHFTKLSMHHAKPTQKKYVQHVFSRPHKPRPNKTQQPNCMMRSTKNHKARYANAARTTACTPPLHLWKHSGNGRCFLSCASRSWEVGSGGVA